jgi:hypothetical protein
MRIVCRLRLESVGCMAVAQVDTQRTLWSLADEFGEE